MKARFLTPLRGEVRDDDSFILYEPFHVELARPSGSLWHIIVPTAFVSDFASVPRTPLAWWIAGDVGRRSAVVHDYLCVLGKSLTPVCDYLTAADVFDACLKAEDVADWRRWMMVRAVRWFGPRF